MEDVVYRSLGSPSKNLKAGPRRGLDNAILSAGRGRVMVITVDPISAIPAFGTKLSARLSVHLIASDYTSAGVDPQFATFAYNFPAEMNLGERAQFVRNVGSECGKLGVSIVGGHTGSYPGGGYTVIGAGSMFGFVKEGGYVTPAMAKPGNAIMITKHAAIEAAGSLALCFPEFVENKLGPSLTKKARRMIRLCSTVEDSRRARTVGLGRGGITSMHDATEGGVLGALEEMSAASGTRFEVEPEEIPVSAEASGVCAAFGLDPLRTMGEGALLVTCDQGVAGELDRRMYREGLPITLIGKVVAGSGLVVRKAGTARRFRPSPDRYWQAYDEAVRHRLH